MQRRTLLRLSLAASASLVLAGCGFRLRGQGSTALPFASLAVNGAQDKLSRLMVKRLQVSDVNVDEAAALVLNLGPESFSEQRLSVLDSGQQEYDMRLVVPFSVQRSSDNAYRLDQQRIEVQERFTLSSDNLLASDERRDDVRQRLRHSAVEQLINRLGALDNQ